jgi:hypothetical protein
MIYFDLVELSSQGFDLKFIYQESRSNKRNFNNFKKKKLGNVTMSLSVISSSRIVTLLKIVTTGFNFLGIGKYNRAAV